MIYFNKQKSSPQEKEKRPAQLRHRYDKTPKTPGGPPKRATNQAVSAPSSYPRNMTKTMKHTKYTIYTPMMTNPIMTPPESQAESNPYSNSMC